MGKTGLNVEHLRGEVQKILDSDAMSPEELAQASGIARTTLYRILDVKTRFTQRAIARKIAEGTGRNLRIEGDKVFFEKKKPVEVNDTPSVDKTSDTELEKLIFDIENKLKRNLSDNEIKQVNVLRGRSEGFYNFIIEMLEMRLMKARKENKEFNDN